MITSPTLTYRPNADSEDACVRCGYTLFDIKDDQPCPECGLLAERSRSPSDELRDSRPGYLRRLSAGVWLILAAVLMPIALWAFVVVWDQYFRYRVGRISIGPHEGLLVLDGIATLLLVGVWLLTSPERKRPRSPRDLPLRVAAMVPLLACLLGHLFLMFDNGFLINRLIAFGWSINAVRELQWYGENVLPWVIIFLLTLGLLPLPILLFGRLAELAKRLLSAHMREHSFIVGYGVAATIVLATATFLFIHLAPQFGLGSGTIANSDSVTFSLLACFTCAGLFGLWGLVLLASFGLAFRRERYELRRAWAIADRGQS